MERTIRVTDTLSLVRILSGNSRQEQGQLDNVVVVGHCEKQDSGGKGKGREGILLLGIVGKKGNHPIKLLN